MRAIILTALVLCLLGGAWLGFVWWFYLRGQGSEIARDGAYRDAVVVTHTEVRDNIHILTGDRVNVAFMVGPDGVLVIDTDVRWMTPKILAALREITDAPIRMLINTHAHGDHRGGNALFRGEGADIVALAETRQGNRAGQLPRHDGGGLPERDRRGRARDDLWRADRDASTTRPLRIPAGIWWSASCPRT